LAFANFTAWRALALHATKNEKAALPLYEKAYSGGTKNVQALLAYGLLLLRRGGRDERAVEVFKAASKRKMNARQWLSLYQNLGLAYWLRGDLDRALTLFSRIYQRSQSASVRGIYGLLLIEKGDQSGDYGEALRFCEEAAGYDGEDSVLVDNLAQVLSRTGGQGERERAEALFRKALELSPAQFDSLCGLAKLCAQTGREEEARALLKKALLRPESRFNAFSRGEALDLARRLGLEDE
jgi:tetratricopeptide (TPR) repeat protein